MPNLLRTVQTVGNRIREEVDRTSLWGDLSDAVTRSVEDVFDAHTQEALRRSQVQQTDASRGPPSASASAIQSLPRIKVCREDLFDPTNRTCSVCLESIQLYDTNIVRMPCAHLFHTDCLVDWLDRHCTCPVCRYELPTDDPDYETGRRARMAERKPRYTRAQLEKLSVGQLKTLLSSSNTNNSSRPYRAVDKSDLVDHVIAMQCVELIDEEKLLDPPVQFTRRALQAMSIGTLKKKMNEAGVFFNASEVVEKTDLISIWEESGRLQILPPEKDDMEVVGNNGQTTAPETGSSFNRRPLETRNREPLDRIRRVAGDIVVETVESPRSTPTAQQDERLDPTQLLEENLEFVPMEVAPGEESNHMQHNQGERSRLEDENDDEHELQADLGESSTANAAAAVSLAETISADEQIPMIVESQAQKPRFEAYSSAELRRQAAAMFVDLSSCFERQDVIRALESAEIQQMDEWDEWRESEIRAIAALAKIDLTHCRNRRCMMQALKQASDNDLRLGRYLRAIAPLARMTTSQLRSLAREWQVSISDCLEKGDILQRLAKTGKPTRQFEN